MPPMYWSTGIQCCASLPKGNEELCGSQYRKKYHEESMSVSIVSVSRFALPLQDGQVVLTKSSLDASGLPWPLKMTCSGRTTGSWSSGTGIMPHLGQYTT